MPTGDREKRPLRVRTQRAVGKAFGIDQRSVARWVAKGMPVIRLESENWYDLDDIYEWRVAYESAQNMTANSSVPAPAPVLADAIPKMGELAVKVNEFKLKRADYFTARQMENLSVQDRIRKIHLDDKSDEELAKMTTSEAMKWYGKLGLDAAIWFDKEEKERTKSVDDVNKILDIIGKLKDLEGVR